MNSINLALDIPEDVSLNILSFLNAQELIEVALTCKKLKTWADDFHLWQAKSEAEFTGLVANGAKQPDKSWKQTYFELKKAKKKESTIWGRYKQLVQIKCSMIALPTAWNWLSLPELDGRSLIPRYICIRQENRAV